MNALLPRLALLLTLGCARAQTALPPSHADLAYGPHARNVMDLWKAPGDKPAPLLVYLHGGAYLAGDKAMVRKAGLLEAARAAGVSVAAVNYRFRPTPIQDILRDCGRAVQHLRANAGELGIDPSRLALYGNSAGATASLWLAFHDDLADAASPDPVLRQSSKPTCVVALNCQFSLNIPAWREVFGDEVRLFDTMASAGGLFYGMPDAQVRSTPAGQAVLRDCHLPAWIDARDPPVFLATRTAGGPSRNYNQLVHHPRHIQVLLEACRNAGVSAIADAPGVGLRPAADEPANLQLFLKRHLAPAQHPPGKAQP